MLHTLSPTFDGYDVILKQAIMKAEAPHFTWGEVRCHGFEQGFDCCWGRVLIHERILLKAEEIRKALGNNPLIVLSGYRCPMWNKEIGGKIHSRHLEGLAMDIQISFYELDGIYDIITKLLPFSGLGLYNWGIHIDMDTSHGKRRWDARKDL